MSVAVFSPYPLSTKFRAQLESRYASPTYMDLRKLRQDSPLGLFGRLRRVSARRAVVALEDSSAYGALPILQIVAALTAARELVVCDPFQNETSFGRWRSFASLFSGSTRGLLGALKAAVQGFVLAKAPRRQVELKGNNALYLNANLWFGVKAGGSVGHISGVVNGLMDRGFAVTFASLGGRLLIDSRAAFQDIPPPSSYGLPYDNNYFSYDDHVTHVLQGLRKPSFIYQRLSIYNFSGAKLAKLWRVPLVVEYNGSEVWVAQNWGRPLRHRALAELLERVMLEKATVVVTISKVLAEELIQRGVERSRIVMYPNCIDPGRFDPTRFSKDMTNSLRERYGIPPDAVVGCFVGTFGPWHGVDVLAKTVRRMCLENAAWLREKKVHFLFVGDGLKMTEVKDTLSASECAGFYTLAGLVPQDEAPLHLAAADFLLSPHVPNEDGSRFFGSPTKLFEYMAMDKAIIASDLDQIGEVLANGVRIGRDRSGSTGEEVAVLTTPADIPQLVDAIRLVVDDPALARRLGRNARARVLSQYTWQHHVGAILERLEQVVSGAKA